MNRETKYRVWRLDTNTLVAYEFLTEDGWKYKLANNLHGCKWDDAPNYDGVFSPSHFQATYKCRREQYTGYQDKDGVELYENDDVDITCKTRGALTTYTTRIVYDKFFTVRDNKTKLNGWAVLFGSKSNIKKT